MSSEVQTIPTRDQVAAGDSWDLTDLYPSDEAWEADFKRVEERLPALTAFRGTLADGDQNLLGFFQLDVEVDRVLGRLYHYAHRASDQDLSNGHYQGLADRASRLWSRASEASSFFRSELLALPVETLDGYLTSEVLAGFRFNLEQIVRGKPHTLSEPEERLLAMASDVTRAPYDIFAQLNDADLTFGMVEDEEGNQVEVSQGTYIVYLSKPERSVRKQFFETFYDAYLAHKNTFAASLASAVKRDIFYARARGFEGSREAALFKVEVPETVYDSLISAVHNHLPTLHRYFDLRKRLLGLDELHFYDVMVPILSDIQVHHPYEEAVDKVVASLHPLGAQYTDVLDEGLRRGWVDRYENRGKRSGAYSACCYDAHPYILLNYSPDELNHVYTLTHEAGHAMHSWLSHKHQPPQVGHYVIFVAEVASTFNEVLLTQHLLDSSTDDRMKAYILNREIDMIRSTIFRQTMFAEYEHLLHAHAEAEKPLSIDAMTEMYHDVLVRYFGPGFTLDPQLDYEYLRIPHFYYNFYVFQYATGLSAAYALADRVRDGGQAELDAYLGFLRAGGSKYPIDILRDAGVDMTTPQPVEAALRHFGRRVDELEALIG